MPLLSVVIPTHRRACILQKCLHHLEKQTIASDLDVIVVHDGRDSDTARLVRFEEWQVRVRYMEIEKAQQGQARNQGVALAAAPLTLFTGDDIFLAPDACAKHIAAHSSSKFQVPSSKFAVLGHTTWDPACGITPVMRWLEESGWQFGYSKIQQYAHAFLPPWNQPRFTYTSNISLPTALARAHPFRDDVTLYGWEDIEWGWRLAQAGVHLFYEPEAKALHHHAVTLEGSLKRMETLGRSAVHIEKLAPHLHLVPHGWKLGAYHMLSLLPTIRGKHCGAFLKGLYGGKSACLQLFK